MSLETERGELSAIQAHTLFSSSEYGQSLAGRPRWDMQRPEHVSVEEWQYILGRDADNLDHMLLTHNITDRFLSWDDGSLNTNDVERDILRMAAICHDWGESINPTTGIGGDINFEHKTHQNTLDEIETFRKVFTDIFGEVDVKTKHLIEAAVFKKDSKLGMIFDAIERVGYLRTAIIAHNASKKTDDEVLKGNLEWLAAGTLSNQVVSLMEYAADYTPVKEYLDAAAPLINEMFDSIDPDVFISHDQPQNEKRILYLQSKTLWSHSTTRDLEKPETGSALTSDMSSFEARYIKNYDELVKKVEACRTLGMKIVLTSGSFDLLHIGHMRYLERARSFGDLLVVGVDSDEKIKQRKGPDRPVVNETERLQMLSHVRGVGFITLKNPADPKWELIKSVHPDILIATAETYTPEEIEELEANYCKRVVVLEPQATTSTTARIRKLNIGMSSRVIQPYLDDSTGRSQSPQANEKS